jgi:hypothetical protein
MRISGRRQPEARTKGRLYDRCMTRAWTVSLPAGVAEPFEVYVNGILQQRDVDYVLEGRTLAFGKPLAQEGKLGLLRWSSIFLGIAGTYRKNDSVDVVYTADGRQVVATGLRVSPPSEDPPDS